jgi:two-component system NarL family sensor kinase
LERDRISRELHDTVNQSLTGIEMRLEVVRRHAATTAPHVAAEVAEIQPLLTAQSVELRQLVERLRHDDLDARRLPGAVANFVERFGRHGDIDARLEWGVGHVDLPPQRCTEVSRIIQEALFNVRRHSGATRVRVRVESDVNGWTLIVEDNGRGFGFTGRLTDKELDLRDKAPRVIRGRVLALGGSLAIESSQLGARLEITFPTDGGLT